MLQTSGIFKLTLRENLRGQVLWTSTLVGSVLLILTGVIGGIALSHENRVVDVFSYFISDQLLLLVGIFSGASLCSNDFSARGMAELYIPAGVSRHALFLARLNAYAFMLLLVSMALYCLKIFLLPQLADVPTALNLKIQCVMIIFSWLKSTTALAIAAFFGCLARPLFASLATLILFSMGHLTSTFDSLLTSAQLSRANDTLGLLYGPLYFALKIWNPSLLTVESLNGEWLIPAGQAILLAISWSAGFILCAVALALFRINSMNIRQ